MGQSGDKKLKNKNSDLAPNAEQYLTGAIAK